MSATLTRAERETVVVWTEADTDVRIISSSPAQIAKLRADDRFHEVPSAYADGLTAEFLIPVGEFNLSKAAKRRVSDAERAALTARLRKQPA
jgi:hypothetical protein